MPTSPLNAKSQLGLRILLDNNANNCLQQMEETLTHEKEFIKINSSKLASWIVNYFYQQNFDVQSDSIAKDHFDLKKYLKSMANSIGNESTPENILEMALENLKKTNIHKRQRPTAVKNQEKNSNGA